MDGNLQWSYSGPVLPGGFLSFQATAAGSTAEIDDLRIYEYGPALSIETAAVRLRWFADSNVTYQVQCSNDMHAWSDLTSVLGTGAETNLLEWTDGHKKYYRLTIP